MLRRFDLDDKADVHPFLLSGGQKRRLSVGTALVAGAPVLALDEPTFGQDRARADELLGLLEGLSATARRCSSSPTTCSWSPSTRPHDRRRRRTRRRGCPDADVFADDALLRSAGCASRRCDARSRA
jgi:energy-coupling factor transport system ATP-binding protein